MLGAKPAFGRVTHGVDAFRNGGELLASGGQVAGQHRLGFLPNLDGPTGDLFGSRQSIFPSTAERARAHPRCCRSRNRYHPVENPRANWRSRPNQSRIVLSYSVRLSLRAVTRPGLGEMLAASSSSRASIHRSIRLNCSTVGRGFPGGGMRAARSSRSTACQRSC